MTTSLLFGFLGVVALMLYWLLIQNLWRQTFADQISDEDVLAERRSCGDCGCGGGVCKVGSGKREVGSGEGEVGNRKGEVGNRPPSLKLLRAEEACPEGEMTAGSEVL